MYEIYADMPSLKIDRIVSFSSEDTIHTANNLLLSDLTKKWKCNNPGEKSATVVLQLEKASIITAIDVGNENTAYIEVLVTRSGMEDEYKVLLVMSSLMTPIESRQSTNINRVRMFTKEHLSKPECDQKWDRIKVVCTQPFNRHVQYGLSFIKFHSSDGSNASENSPPVEKFTLRAPSPDTFSAGRLFLRRKEEEKQEPPTIAAAIRKADYTPEAKRPTKLVENLKRKDSGGSSEITYNSPKRRNDISLLYDKDEQRLEKLTTKNEKETSSETQQGNKQKTLKPKNEGLSKNKQTLDTRTSGEHPDMGKPSTSKKRANGVSSQPKKKLKLQLSKPFNRLLEGVTIVISGIQNPDRGELRSKALEMGAKYSGDWNDRCTHLICAFANTPKFNQVRGKGKIVTKKWIEECYAQRKRLPWRRYYLDRNDKDKDESEEEIFEEVFEPPKDDNSSGSDTDKYNCLDEGSDTEERIQKILLNKQEKNEVPVNQECDDIYSADTEPENSEGSDNIEEIEPNFKNFFSDNIFFIDSNLGKDMYRLLQKYITAYNGKIIDDPTERMDIYVTNESKSEEIGDMNPSAKTVRPEWVWQCHNQQKIIPIDEYVI